MTRVGILGTGVVVGSRTATEDAVPFAGAAEHELDMPPWLRLDGTVRELFDIHVARG